MGRRALVACICAAVAIPATAFAKGKVFFEDTVPSGKSSSVAIQTHQAPSFKVLLRVPTQGRAKLFLLGKTAPKGGPLIDTRTYACQGAAVVLQGLVWAAAEGHVHMARELGRRRQSARAR